ncbi:MAG: hypothetical protein JO095_17150 [Alphaproteobacteria bacterium]|nr:hypothetical protein [Alphaproteobacteria bacterium]
MAKLSVMACSLILVLSAAPSHAQGPGDVLQGIGRAMNGAPPPPPPDYRWREHERERAYWHEQHRLDAEQGDLDARRRALHDERRYNEENGFYGR